MSDKKAYLKEMGIDVWVEKTPSLTEATVMSENTVSGNTLHKESISPAVELVEVTLVVDEKKVATNQAINVAELDWQALELQVSGCQLCELSQTRTQTNFGTGNQAASLMIFSEENNPQSDKLLTSMLRAMGLQRNEVYISNTIKCHLPENSNVSDEQVDLCAPYLLRQISLVKPKVILALGNAAAQRLLKSKSTMSRLRGQLHYIDEVKSPVIVSYHPTYLLAAPNEKRKAWQDLQLVMKELSA